MRVFRTVKLSTSSKATFPEPRQFFLLVELVRHVRGDLYTICGRAMCFACWLEQLLADLDDPGADDFVIGYGLQAIQPALSILSNVERHLRLHRARQ